MKFLCSYYLVKPWVPRKPQLFVRRKDFPNIICTTFAANALLDAHERKAGFGWIEAAMSAADFVLQDLYHRENPDKAYFRYTLVTQDMVHNANLLGAFFLSRVARFSGVKKYLKQALEATRWSVSQQQEDGSWAYGEASTQQWIDNFHTGFNQVSFQRIRKDVQTMEFDRSIRRGLDFFGSHFFRENGTPRYYHYASYSIDIPSRAQSIITLVELSDFRKGNISLAHSVLNWAMAKMWDRRGFFYYQNRPHITVRTSLMRWFLAWRLMALATLLSEGSPDGV